MDGESSIYNVKTEVFEGPLDLLLALIEKRKLFINDISLASVTDDYIAYINNLTTFPLSQAANFILIASSLLLLKSKSLIPTLTLTDEEEESIEDLERRLKLYKKYKALSRYILERFGKHILFSKSPTRTKDPIFSPPDDLTVRLIKESVQDVLHNFPKKETIPKAVVKKVISLEEMINRLAERMKEGIETSFKEFAGVGKKEKIHIIMSFLAMLELVKQGIVSVRQEGLFSDITIESDK